jgi:hypothetical protein
MTMKQIVAMLALALLIPVGDVSLRAQGMGSEESLKTVHGLLLQSVTSGNVTMVGNLVHPQAIGFFRDSQQLVQLRPGYGPGEVVPAVLADLNRFSSIPYDTVYRVTGDAGVVAMTSRSVSKEGDLRDRFLRSTFVYVQAQGTWKLFSWHTSDTPLKR